MTCTCLVTMLSARSIAVSKVTLIPHGTNNMAGERKREGELERECYETNNRSSKLKHTRSSENIYIHMKSV